MFGLGLRQQVNRLIGRIPMGDFTGEFLDVLVLSPYKSGTTSLFNWLCTHPRIQGSRKKEIHYFSANYSEGLTWYRRHFPIFKRDYYFVEASPSYFSCPQAPGRIFEHSPNVKFIVLLRDPVDRTISHYFFRPLFGRVESGLMKTIESESEALGRLRNARGEEIDQIRWKSGYIDKSLYATHLRRYFKTFSKERFLYVRAESLFNDTQRELSRIWGFLGIDPHSPDTSQILMKSPPYPRCEEARKALRTYFDPLEAELRNLLKENTIDGESLFQ